MYLERKVDSLLQQWKAEENRKPLLIRGARQVGKSSAVKHFGTSFTHFISLNMEADERAREVFAQYQSPIELCDTLSILYHTPIVAGETLLFIDEIQASLPAIMSLRYFYEQYPGLHVIAAGSLLEFALQELPSFGVGRIRSLFMYPFSFDEFLIAAGQEALVQRITQASSLHPMPNALHTLTLDYLRKFLVIGGMPEVVSTYIETGSLLKCQYALDDLIYTFQDDFAKYKKQTNATLLHEIFLSAVRQSGSKFVYNRVAEEFNHKQTKAGVAQLQMAGLLIPVTHTSGNGIPLGAEVNPKMQKMLLFDTGIYQRLIGLDLATVMLDADFINKGAIAEMFVGLELLKGADMHDRTSLYYWQREAKSSNAEVDYVIQRQHDVIPLEVISGKTGSMKSLYLFLEEKKRPFGIRLSLENFGEMGQIHIVPLYDTAHI